MTIRAETTLLAIGFATLAMPASAQWPSYPTPNVPRNADGTPNLTAPAPRAADGKPDLSGVWEIYLNSIAAAPPPGQASPSRSLQDSADSGDDNQLGLYMRIVPPDWPGRPALRRPTRLLRPVPPSSTSARTSKAGRRFKIGRASCARSAWPTTRRTTPTRCACRWASCSSMAIRSRARSYKHPSSS